SCAIYPKCRWGPRHGWGIRRREGFTPMATIAHSGLVSRVRGRDLSLALFERAALAGLITMLTRPIPFGHGFEMVALATNLAQHGTYANPFGTLPTGLSAANPPLYPLLLALLMAVLPAPLVALAATALNIVANAIAAMLLPRVSRVFFGDPS